MKLAVTELEIEVRTGTAEDVPLLLSFIRSMAEFEKLEVTATEEVLRESLDEEELSGLAKLLVSGGLLKPDTM